MGDVHDMVDGGLYLQSVQTARDLAAEVAQLTTELANATTRADSLDVRAAAAERVAIAAAGARETGQVLTHRGSELTNALELWDRVQTQDHPTRANDYADAVMQLAGALPWVPDLDENYRRAVQRNADHWGQTVSEWLADTIAQHLAQYGVK